MRPHPLWLLLVEDENGKLQDGDLSANQQRPAADASRCSRVSGWHLCSPDGLTRGSGGYGAPTSCAAKNASRGSSPEARHLRGLKTTRPPALLAAGGCADRRLRRVRGIANGEREGTGHLCSASDEFVTRCNIGRRNLAFIPAV